MKTLMMILALIGLVACESGGGAGGASTDKVAPKLPSDNGSTPVNPSQPSAPNAPTPTPTPIVVTTIGLTYYSLTATVTPHNPGHSYTATGSCVQYNGYTFCWDDGMKLIPQYTTGGFTTGDQYWSYFGIGTYTGLLRIGCPGICLDDLATSPRVVSATLAANAAFVTKVNAIATTGTPKVVTCSLSGSTLNCVDFVIDLNQAPL